MSRVEQLERRAGERARRAPLKVAIVGFGTVGRSVAKVLSSGIHPSLQLDGDLQSRSRAQESRLGAGRCRLDRQHRRRHRVRRRHRRRADGRPRACRRSHQAVARRRASPSSPPTSSSSRRMASSCWRWRANRSASCCSRRPWPAAFPIVRAVREGLAGDRLLRVAGHPERHLQLHPDAHGQRGPVVCRRAERGAGAWICRGGSDGRRRRLRRAGEDRHPDRGRAGLPGRSRSHSLPLDLVDRSHRFHVRAKARLHDPADLVGRACAGARHGSCLRRCGLRSFRCRRRSRGRRAARIS